MDCIVLALQAHFRNTIQGIEKLWRGSDSLSHARWSGNGYFDRDGDGDACRSAGTCRRDPCGHGNAVDRNGYIPCHNQAYNHPQRAGDTAWNTAHCRNRRIFADRTGLASARNQRPFLLQTYRRDMGGGNYVVMKEVAAPITVAGRHWGGLRLAFKF